MSSSQGFSSGKSKIDIKYTITITITIIVMIINVIWHSKCPLAVNKNSCNLKCLLVRYLRMKVCVYSWPCKTTAGLKVCTRIASNKTYISNFLLATKVLNFRDNPWINVSGFSPSATGGSSAGIDGSETGGWTLATGVILQLITKKWINTRKQFWATKANQVLWLNKHI